MRLRVLRMVLAVLGIPLAPAFARADAPSFRTEVMAVLSKAGCNTGPCHGNASGKGGFKLSLRGEDPERDYQALTRELFGRRVDLAEPSQSLILLKPTTQLAHEGGLRFEIDSAEYQALKGWIAAGATDDVSTAPTVQELRITPSQPAILEPTNSVRLRVEARFSDGARRDVSALAVYELPDTLAKVSASGTVTLSKPGETTLIVRYLDRQEPVRVTLVPQRPEPAIGHPVVNYVDEHIFAKLKRLRLAPSEPCSDSDFVRRAYLDLLGLLPSGEEARTFVCDTRPGKRRQLVSGLLERREFADFWALKWADLLRNEEKVLDRKGVQTFHRWIRQSIATNQPLDRFVAEILEARGSSYGHPAANFMRALRDPVKRAEATAQVFLGTRLQCAQCHNHPFDRWTQSDYYGWAAVFAPVSYKVIENNRRDGLDSHEFIGEQIIFASSKRRVQDPRTGKAAEPRLLGASRPEGTAASAMASWVVANPQFARAQANRIWSYLMGRGLVDPVDDFRLTNPASHPELLEELTADFVRSGFDVRHLIRVIASSSAYGLSSHPNETNREDVANYARTVPRRLTAEQLVDAQHGVLDVPPEFSGYPAGMRAAQLPGVVATRRRRQPQLSSDDQMLKVFGKPERLLTCECERSNETSMSQAFQLIGGPAVHELLTQKDNRLGQLLDSQRSPAEIVTEIYWAALSRPPSEVELARAVGQMETSDTPRSGLEDVAWALLNAKEFILRK